MSKPTTEMTTMSDDTKTDLSSNSLLDIPPKTSPSSSTSEHQNSSIPPKKPMSFPKELIKFKFVLYVIEFNYKNSKGQTPAGLWIRCGLLDTSPQHDGFVRLETLLSFTLKSSSQENVQHDTT